MNRASCDENRPLLSGIRTTLKTNHQPECNTDLHYGQNRAAGSPFLCPACSRSLALCRPDACADCAMIAREREEHSGEREFCFSVSCAHGATLAGRLRGERMNGVAWRNPRKLRD